MRRNNDIFDDTVDGGIFQSLLRAAGAERLYVRGPLWAFLVLGGTVAVLAGVLWYSYPREAARQAVEATPLIRADARPYRAAPEEPGGMDVPNRDSTVFESLREAKGTKGLVVENLLDDSEQPLPKAELFAAQESEKASRPADITEDLTEEGPGAQKDGSGSAAQAAQVLPEAAKEPGQRAVAAQQSAQPVEPVEDEAHAKPEPAPVPAKAAAKALDEKEEKSAAAVEPAAGESIAASALKAGYFAQLASVQSKDAAAGEWKKLQKQFSAPLSGLDYRVQQADLGAKGIYYRVQAGPLTKEKAVSLCDAVKKSRPGGCLVVGR